MKRNVLLIPGLVCLALLMLTMSFLTACSNSSSTPAPSSAAPKPAPASAPSSSAAQASAPKAGATIIWKAVTMQLPTSVTHKWFSEWVKRVNEAAKGEFRIDIIGGAEVIASTDQPEALKNGVIQLNDNPSARYKNMLPEAGAIGLGGPSFDITKWRTSGFDDVMREYFKPKGIYYFGGLRHGDGFWLFLNKKVTKPADLNGMRFRSGVLYDKGLQAIGITPVFMDQNEVYSAMERGVVDGFCDASATVTIYKYQEVTKYWVSPSFLYPAMMTLANLEAYNKLPKNLQDLLQKSFYDIQPEAVKWWDDNVNTTFATMKKSGMQEITFQADDSKYYYDTITNTILADFVKSCPANGQKLLDFAKK